MSIGIRGSSTNRVRPSQCSSRLSKSLPARRRQAHPGQFRLPLGLHRGHGLTQAVIGLPERRRALCRQSPVVEPIEHANPPQPLQGPRLELRPPLADPDEVAPHVGPAERQDDHPVLDPAHRLVGRIAIDHQHAARLGPIVVLGDRVTATGIQQIDHRVRTQHDPQPPAVALLAFQDDEHRPPRLIALMQVPETIPLLDRLVDRPQQDSPAATSRRSRCPVPSPGPAAATRPASVRWADS